MKTIIEPFRIKTVEPIRMITPAQREEILTQPEALRHFSATFRPACAAVLAGG